MLKDITLLVSSGLRSGEGYFSADGQKMVFQSEVDKDSPFYQGNPFYQIYIKDLSSGSASQPDAGLLLVSEGSGKTTCGWIHPSGDKVLFSSTHRDEERFQKQADEIARRESGEKSKYAWDYDPTYDIFVRDFKSIQESSDFAPLRVTEAFGYDAEGSFSPDGEKILFVSNRHAYTDELSEELQKKFNENPSILIDLYIMNADGSNVKRLTHNVGYDGGPFFNKEGNQIVWRRF